MSSVSIFTPTPTTMPSTAAASATVNSNASGTTADASSVAVTASAVCFSAKVTFDASAKDAASKFKYTLTEIGPCDDTPLTTKVHGKEEFLYVMTSMWTTKPDFPCQVRNLASDKLLTTKEDFNFAMQFIIKQFGDNTFCTCPHGHRAKHNEYDVYFSPRVHWLKKITLS